MTWTRTNITPQDLSAGPVVFKAPPRQLALFLSEGTLFAVDNRCPHEGYPLAEGHVTEGCILTCNWHNWKFRLDDGECIIGGDDVKTYAAEVRNGQVWVDLTDPSPEETAGKILRGLRDAFQDRDYGRICREITRLECNGLDSTDALRRAIDWSHDRFEYSTTHAYAASADWLREASLHAGDWERRLVCLAEAVDHMANDALRHPVYPFSESAEPFSEAALLGAIEVQDSVMAEGLLLGAMTSGLTWPELEPILTRAALAHYNSFGHALIFVYKTGQLIEDLGEEMTRPLALNLTRHLCFATREDLLPEFRNYGRSLEVLRNPGTSDDLPEGSDRLQGASLSRLFTWIVSQFQYHSPAIIHSVLLEVNGWNLLTYDTDMMNAHQIPVSKNSSWLDVTHGVTFSNAVRILCSRYPELWAPGLLQMACFAGRNSGLLDRNVAPDEWEVEDETAFIATVREKLLDHGFRDPIFSAHLIKTFRAVEEELATSGPEGRRVLLAGLNRFLQSPLKEKHARRLAHQAIDLIRRDFE